MTICTAVGSVACDAGKLSLQDLTGDAAGGMIQQSRFVGLVQSALEGALSPNGFNGQYGAARGGEISTSYKGTNLDSADEVGREKGTLVSSASVPDAASTGNEKQDDTLNLIADRINALNLETTAYTIAWRIAQRIQQDISHIMKG